MPRYSISENCSNWTIFPIQQSYNKEFMWRQTRGACASVSTIRVSVEGVQNKLCFWALYRYLELQWWLQEIIFKSIYTKIFSIISRPE